MKLKEIAKVQGGFAFKSDSFVSNETPIIRIGNIINNEIVIDKDITAPISTIGDKKEFLIFKDDLLIAMSGATVGKVGIYSFDSPSMLNQRVGNIKSDKMYKKYIFYLLQSPKFKKYVELSSIGCAQPNISNSQIENFEFKENSIDQIEKMVRKLDSVNSLINIKKSEIEKCKELVKSQFVEMFDNSEYNKLKVSDVCESIIRGPFGSALKKEFFVEKGINTYKVYEQKNAINSDSTLGIYYIDENRFKELKRFECRPGDIIMSCSGTIGKLLILPESIEKGVINQALLKYRVDNNKVTSQYFVDYIKLNINKLETKGTGLQNLGSVSFIKDMLIPVPPIEEQIRYEKIVEQIDKQKFEFEKSLKKLEELQASLMQEYFG